MRSLIEYFNSGNIFKGNNTYIFRVVKFSDLTDKIIPFFKNYPVLGLKSKDFYD
jgi:LAGLIDADG endonuclease.